jgi:fluoride exporter
MTGAMAVGLADNRGECHRQSLPDEVGGLVSPSSHTAVARPRAAVHWDVLAVVAVGGALGSLARWGVGEVVPWNGEGFPWATFVENVSGAFALGVLMALLLDVWPPRRYVRPFVGVGLLGGYTTFSTYMLEARDLLAGDRVPLALAYLGGTLVTGLLAVWAGIVLARLAVRLSQRRRRRRRERERSTAPSRRDDTRSSS